MELLDFEVFISVPPAVPKMSPSFTGVCLVVLSGTKAWLSLSINFEKYVFLFCAIVSLTLISLFNKMSLGGSLKPQQHLIRIK